MFDSGMMVVVVVVEVVVMVLNAHAAQSDRPLYSSMLCLLFVLMRCLNELKDETL